MVQEMRLSTVYEHFMRPIIALAAALALAIASSACTGGPTMDDGIISGVVEGENGPEAGVWVIAETNDLGSMFARIVATDDEGRYLVPDLPPANYTIWVRGYGLADSEKVDAKPGSHIDLTAVIAPDAATAARVYPAAYWYAMMDLPSGWGKSLPHMMLSTPIS